jgi:hypothetical protein
MTKGKWWTTIHIDDSVLYDLQNVFLNYATHEYIYIYIYEVILVTRLIFGILQPYLQAWILEFKPLKVHQRACKGNLTTSIC